MLVPARDAADTIDACLDSVAAQSLAEHEVVVVDDGSRDETAGRIASRARRDPRIRLLERPAHGLVAALNEGLEACRAPLVARLDADDLAHRQRLALQRAYLEAERSVAVVGSRVRVFPHWHVGKGFRAYLRWQNAVLSAREHAEDIFLEAPLAHPSVTFRRATVLAAGGYRNGAFPEDYELWLRLVEGGAQLAKLPRVLLDWRQGPRSLSRVDPRYSRTAFDTLRAGYLSRDVRLGGGRAVAVWGAGRRTRLRVRALARCGVRPDLWVDVDPRKIGRRLDGAPVLGPAALEALRGAERPFVLVYVARHGARSLVARSLESAGYAKGRDWLHVG